MKILIFLHHVQCWWRDSFQLFLEFWTLFLCLKIVQDDVGRWSCQGWAPLSCQEFEGLVAMLANWKWSNNHILNKIEASNICWQVARWIDHNLLMMKSEGKLGWAIFWLKTQTSRNYFLRVSPLLDFISLIQLHVISKYKLELFRWN